ncbi:DUF5711 family protein [Roseburia sp. MSJ-14]|uniref:DUF5711 family protein n=1 Tax=Roseburia sp. MSJ-14 TaxID=2841514 RepID=UPI001C10ABF3|nr:DUF5711 family protein [Roseburia sp. MSJ-14]MBU5474402.1 hypothetical protein [Roseburia sp. MSJ-14]
MAEETCRVVQSDIEEMHEKIRAHRRKILKWICVAVVLVLLIVTAVYFYFQSKVYSKYEVINSVEREDSAGTQFVSFAGKILKYGKDGATCIDEKNQLIWNQTYEMQSPMVDICEGYVAIAEKKGNKIYIMNTKGKSGEIETTMPIQRVRVANQGTVAILMEQEGTGYLQLYDKEGTFLAEGEVHTENSGYPLDIALSNDGRKMAVSQLNMNEGTVKNTITFYNFGSVGQNEIDNIVGTYSYSDVIFPKVEFLTNDVMVAFGDEEAIIFEGTQKPQVKKEISLKQEIHSIFYNEAYIGFVFNNDNEKETYRISVYNLRGTEEMTQNLDMNYSEVGFLENDEICVRNELECSIYNLKGKRKFHSNFEKSIWKVFSTKNSTEYIFMMDKETQKVRLK